MKSVIRPVSSTSSGRIAVSNRKTIFKKKILNVTPVPVKMAAVESKCATNKNDNNNVECIKNKNNDLKKSKSCIKKAKTKPKLNARKETEIASIKE